MGIGNALFVIDTENEFIKELSNEFGYATYPIIMENLDYYILVGAVNEVDTFMFSKKLKEFLIKVAEDRTTKETMLNVVMASRLKTAEGKTVNVGDSSLYKIESFISVLVEIAKNNNMSLLDFIKLNSFETNIGETLQSINTNVNTELNNLKGLGIEEVLDKLVSNLPEEQIRKYIQNQKRK